MRPGDPRLAAKCPECGLPRARTGTTIVSGKPAPSYSAPCGRPCVGGRPGSTTGGDKKSGFWDAASGDSELGCLLGLVTGALLLVGVPILFVGSWVWSRRPLTRWLLILVGAAAAVAIVLWLTRNPAGPGTVPDPNR